MAVSKAHTGHTENGDIRDAKVERIGRVTVYKRGCTYYLYYRENRKSFRRKVEGNLNSARQAASAANHALAEGRLAPFSFNRISTERVVDEYVDSCAKVRSLAARTVDRYRAALSHFKEFARECDDGTLACQVTERTVEQFVKWMRGRDRVRNGGKEGLRRPYRSSGIKFILSTCRSAFNWAAKQRYLPPYSQNPFSSIGIDLFDKRESTETKMLDVDQQKKFFAACDAWQRRMFLILAIYGMRVGELTHLLISDVDWEKNTFVIRSKPELFWHVKTSDERSLPVLPGVRDLLEECRGDRKEGFLFLNREYAEGKSKLQEKFDSHGELIARAIAVAEGARAGEKTADDVAEKKVRDFLRQMGQIPEKRIRQEYMKVTKHIGCPEHTRAHSLRYMFATRAQEYGTNPLLVQGILGHSSLEMTRRYTHLGLEAKREAVGQIIEVDPVFKEFLVKKAPACPA